MTICAKEVDGFYQFSTKIPEIEESKFPISEWNQFVSLWTNQFRFHQWSPIIAGVTVVAWCATFWVLAAIISMMPFNLIAWAGLILWFFLVFIYYFKYRPTSREVNQTLKRANENIFDELGVVVTFHHGVESIFDSNELRFRIKSKSALRHNYAKRHPHNSSMTYTSVDGDYAESIYENYFRKSEEFLPEPSNTDTSRMGLRGATTYSEVTISTPRGDTFPADFTSASLDMKAMNLTDHNKRSSIPSRLTSLSSTSWIDDLDAEQTSNATPRHNSDTTPISPKRLVENSGTIEL